MLVTKSRSDQSIGEELPGQFLNKPKALPIAAGMIFVLGIVPGMPTLAFWPIAIVLLIVHKLIGSKQAEFEAAQVQKKQQEAAAPIQPRNPSKNIWAATASPSNWAIA